ncbi:chemotaxis protein CheW [Roseomonas sp. BN140053]|uniref:chemotaxis protein CheW n=1 Tax=Roseomonas sp. BN140053 TaxID=3391898 RepID=UPI0039E78CEF
MSTMQATAERRGTASRTQPPRDGLGFGGDEGFLTLNVAGQLCAVPVRSVRDVLGPQTITRIPLAPPEVAGSLNLRGRIVTAVDLRRRLGLPDRAPGEAGPMSVVVEQGTELYALLVDSVGDVVPLAEEGFGQNPPTLDSAWRDMSRGVHRDVPGEEGRLLVVLDIDRVLAIGGGA